LYGRLQAVGLVKGVKEPGGGYRLARSAASISAGDVVQAAEGPVAVVHCTLPCPDEESACTPMDGCVTHLVWKRLSDTIVELLDSISLQDVCDEAQRLDRIVEGL
jgi:Rrf2 family protein